MVQNYECLTAQPPVAVVSYEAEKDIYQKPFPQSSGKETKVRVIIFPSTTVWNLATCFLSIYHKGKLHYFPLIALLGQSRLKFYICQVCENFKPADLIYPALYAVILYRVFLTLVGYYSA